MKEKSSFSWSPNGFVTATKYRKINCIMCSFTSDIIFCITCVMLLIIILYLLPFNSTVMCNRTIHAVDPNTMEHCIVLHKITCIIPLTLWLVTLLIIFNCDKKAMYAHRKVKCCINCTHPTLFYWAWIHAMESCNKHDWVHAWQDARRDDLFFFSRGYSEITASWPMIYDFVCLTFFIQ